MKGEQFNDIEGNKVDPVSYTKKILKENPYVDIHIGTDSQSKAKKTLFTTVIAYRYGNRGVHYILSKIGLPKIKDMWTRLWKEAELSINISELITNTIDITIEIDMDYNESDNFKSHKLVAATKGWANSLGYKVNVKPNNQIATKAADHHCKKF